MARPLDSHNAPVDTALVRRILQLMYDPGETGGIAHDNPIVSPPHLAGVEQEAVYLVLDRLSSQGWIRPSNEIKTNPPPDPLLWRLTAAGLEWARVAWDPDAWTARTGELDATLNG
jgi:hypothetical protein